MAGEILARCHYYTRCIFDELLPTNLTCNSGGRKWKWKYTYITCNCIGRASYQNTRGTTSVISIISTRIIKNEIIIKNRIISSDIISFINEKEAAHYSYASRRLLNSLKRTTGCATVEFIELIHISRLLRLTKQPMIPSKIILIILVPILVLIIGRIHCQIITTVIRVS